MFDIITQDLEHGPVAAGAELIAVANNILNTFPNLGQMYNIHVSHSSGTTHASFLSSFCADTAF